MKEKKKALVFHNLLRNWLSSSFSTDKPTWKLFCISFLAGSLAFYSIGALASFLTFPCCALTVVGALAEYHYVL